MNKSAARAKVHIKIIAWLFILCFGILTGTFCFWAIAHPDPADVFVFAGLLVAVFAVCLGVKQADLLVAQIEQSADESSRVLEAIDGLAAELRRRPVVAADSSIRLSLFESMVSERKRTSNV